MDLGNRRKWVARMLDALVIAKLCSSFSKFEGVCDSAFDAACNSAGNEGDNGRRLLIPILLAHAAMVKNFAMKFM